MDNDVDPMLVPTNKKFSRFMRKKSSWMADALCATKEYRNYPWFPHEDVDKFTQRRHKKLVIQVCSFCPVQAECRTFADKAGVTAGVWGGKYYGG